jgi:hypothetical protein
MTHASAEATPWARAQNDDLPKVEARTDRHFPVRGSERIGQSEQSWLIANSPMPASPRYMTRSARGKEEAISPSICH